MPAKWFSGRVGRRAGGDADLLGAQRDGAPLRRCDRRSPRDAHGAEPATSTVTTPPSFAEHGSGEEVAWPMKSATKRVRGKP